MILVFDMDGVLTQSRTPITEERSKWLFELNKKHTVVIISGSSRGQMEEQLGLGIFGSPFNKGFHILAQSGNEYIDDRGSVVWSFKITGHWAFMIMDHISAIRARFPIPALAESIEDRGGQISFSAIGHKAPLEHKLKFDPTGEIRRGWLKEIPTPKGIEARIGGTTCIDYTKEGHNKGINLESFLRLKGLDKETTVYFGDALFVGGNDETVVGVVRTVKANVDNLILKVGEYLAGHGEK